MSKENNMIDLRAVPFTYPWILNNAIGKAKTILDIGCGTGELMEMLGKEKKWQVTGIDIYGPSIKKAKKTKAYKVLYKGDITKLPTAVTKQKYDVVFSSQVIEHLPKNKSLVLLKQMEKLAKKRIVIGTTVGFMHFLPLQEVHEHQHDDNPYQEHKSSWKPNEFKNLGFITRGQGLFLVYREGYLSHFLPKIFHPVLYGLSLLFAPLVYFFPMLATYQINHKIIQ